jgi:hypothetical protein
MGGRLWRAIPCRKQPPPRKLRFAGQLQECVRMRFRIRRSLSWPVDRRRDVSMWEPAVTARRPGQVISLLAAFPGTQIYGIEVMGNWHGGRPADRPDHRPRCG